MVVTITPAGINLEDGVRFKAEMGSITEGGREDKSRSLRLFGSTL